jgi:hypothetical protein
MGDKTTAVDLVNILSARNKDGRYDKLINEARHNHFHTYKSPLEINNPKDYLIECLAAFPELTDISQEVVAGVYDEPADSMPIIGT